MPLTIGGYKERGNDNPDLIIEPMQPAEPAPAATAEPIQPPVPAPAAEPVVVPTQPNRSSLSFSNPDEGANVVPDEVIFKTLSEKLGREIKDFSELTPQQQSNPLESDPYLNSLVEWRNKTGRPIEDWIKFQKDYTSMSDANVARELLQYKYPNLTEDELNFEMLNYLPTEDDYDNDLIKKNLELKKIATEGRQVLSQLKSSFDQPLETRYTPEVQEDLKLAQIVKQNLANEEANRTQYQNNVKAISGKLDTFKIPLTADLTLDYKISDQSKNEIPSLIDTMPHWRNEDGSTNFEAIVTDAVKIKHFDDIIKVVYDQAFNSGKEALMKETNNVNFNQPMPSGQTTGKKGIVIEGLDQFIGNRGMSIRQ